MVDFGLAKPLQSSPLAAALANSPAITSPAMMSGLSIILGTATHMSPERPAQASSGHRHLRVARRRQLARRACAADGDAVTPLLEERPEEACRAVVVDCT